MGISNIKWLKDIKTTDTSIVGYKSVRLNEILESKFLVPRGFVVTNQEYFSFLQQNNIKINKILKEIDYNNKDSLKELSKNIVKKIINGKLSNDFKAELEKYYNKLGEKKIGWLSSKVDTFVAIRLSLMSEEASKKDIKYLESLGGFLNIKGIHNILEKIKLCFASIFCEEAIEYSNNKKIDLEKIGVAIIIQNMISAKSSGMMLTSKKIGENENTIIEAIYGFGGSDIIKKVNPDHYEVKKKNLEIKVKTKGKQDIELKRILGKTEAKKIPIDLQEKQKLKDRYIKELTSISKKLELHFGVPQYVEWALENSEIFIINAEPLDSNAKVNRRKPLIQESLNYTKKEIANGTAVSGGIVNGNVKIIDENSKVNDIGEDTILVMKKSTPSMTIFLKKAKGIITEFGSTISHAALVAKKYKIPCIINAKNITKILKEGNKIQINGYTGRIYELLKDSNLFKIKNKEESNKQKEYPKTITKIIYKINSIEEIKNINLNNVDGIQIEIKSLFSDYELKLTLNSKDLIVNNITNKIREVVKLVEDKKIYYKINLNKQSLIDKDFSTYEIESFLSLNYSNINLYFENIKSSYDINKIKNVLNKNYKIGVVIEDITKKEEIEKYISNLNIQFIVLNSNKLDNPKDLKEFIKFCKNKKIERIVNIQNKNSYKDIKYFVDFGINAFFIDKEKIEIKYTIYKTEQDMLKNLLSV